MASDKRPGEKLINRGPGSLSDRELLAILLNAGVHGKNGMLLAKELLDFLDTQKNIPSVKELSALEGVGETKACSVVAMLEFGRRRWGVTGAQIKEPDDIYALIRHYADRKQERFVCLSLNGAHEVLAVRLVTVGLVNKTVIHPREVYADPLSDRAVSVIIAHNHPSGQLMPSLEDDEITRRLKEAAEILGLNFLDHLVFSEKSYYSYKRCGKL